MVNLYYNKSSLSLLSEQKKYKMKMQKLFVFQEHVQFYATFIFSSRHTCFGLVSRKYSITLQKILTAVGFEPTPPKRLVP